LSLAEALDVCQQLAALGCEDVVLSGGEAILRSDWVEISRQLVALHVRPSLITNGLLVDEVMARRIAEAGIRRVAVSVDGLREAHDTVRANPRSFERACRAVRLLVAGGLPVNVVTHVNRLNLPGLSALEDLVVSLRASVWRLQLGSPVGRLARHPELTIRPEDLPAIAEFVVGAKARWRVPVSVGDNIGYYTAFEPALRRIPGAEGPEFWCGCSAGCLTMGIEANGNVKGCLSLQADRFIEGNVRDRPLREIWEREGAFSYTRGFDVADLAGHCRGCEYGEVCRGGCTFMAWGATGRPHDNPYCLHGLLNRRRASPGTSP
jgi:radical SAM protein with 4Fe4S-binding SPASM domain